MGFLFFSMAAAMAASINVYMDTGSLLVAFGTYAATGTLVLLSVMLAEALVQCDEIY